MAVGIGRCQHFAEIVVSIARRISQLVGLGRQTIQRVVGVLGRAIAVRVRNRKEVVTLVVGVLRFVSERIGLSNDEPTTVVFLDRHIPKPVFDSLLPRIRVMGVFDRLAQSKCQLRIRFAEFFRFDHIPQANDLAVLVRHLDANEGLSRNAVDADALRF
jgi:hypothetical protein